MIGKRGDHWTDLGECKWGGVASATGLVAELEAKVKLYPNEEKATIGRRLFVAESKKAAISKALGDGGRVHTLEELYELAGGE